MQTAYSVYFNNSKAAQFGQLTGRNTVIEIKRKNLLTTNYPNI